MEDRWHVIGPGDHPILICRKGDVPKLFSDEFVYVYETWKCFHYTRRFPNGEEWIRQDPELVDMIIALENHHKSYFGDIGVVVKYLEVIIKQLSKRLM